MGFLIDVGMTLLRNKFVRFLLVGGLNTAFGYGLLVVFLEIGFPYALAALISTVIGILFNFVTTGRLVFRNQRKSLIFRFLAVYGVVYLANVGGYKLLGFLHLQTLIVAAILVLPLAVFSFVLNKTFVFEVGK